MGVNGLLGLWEAVRGIASGQCDVLPVYRGLPQLQKCKSGVVS